MTDASNAPPAPEALVYFLSRVLDPRGGGDQVSQHEQLLLLQMPPPGRGQGQGEGEPSSSPSSSSREEVALAAAAAAALAKAAAESAGSEEESSASSTSSLVAETKRTLEPLRQLSQMGFDPRRSLGALVVSRGDLAAATDACLAAAAASGARI